MQSQPFVLYILKISLISNAPHSISPESVVGVLYAGYFSVLIFPLSGVAIGRSSACSLPRIGGILWLDYNRCSAIGAGTSKRNQKSRQTRGFCFQRLKCMFFAESGNPGVVPGPTTRKKGGRRRKYFAPWLVLDILVAQLKFLVSERIWSSRKPGPGTFKYVI